MAKSKDKVELDEAREVWSGTSLLDKAWRVLEKNEGNANHVLLAHGIPQATFWRHLRKASVDTQAAFKAMMAAREQKMTDRKHKIATIESAKLPTLSEPDKDETVRKLCGYLRKGMPPRTAIECAGVTHDWIKKTCFEDPNVTLLLTQARAKFRLFTQKALHIAIHKAANKGDIQGVILALERLYPGEFGEVKTLEVRSADDSLLSMVEANPAKVADTKVLTDEELYAIVKQGLTHRKEG